MSRFFKTWVEIKQKAVEHNYETLKALLKPKTKLWAVVKSNAYGHDLIGFSLALNELGVDGFCVDSVVEGLKLRKNKVKKPILVLGPTLPHLLKEAAQNKITITISNFEALSALIKSRYCPQFHIKIDTGMHRQGFYLQDLPKVIKIIRNWKLEIRNCLKGVYTHFASAKDLNYPTYTNWQFQNLKKAIGVFEKAGFKNLVKHAAATGGTLANSEHHLDAVRLGIGLYGLWPSNELKVQRKGIYLKPVLSWHTLISEIKDLKKGDFVGYDLIEQAVAPGKMAILPVGYWHGFSRGFSGVGYVLINGKRARVLGRVSMDLTVVDVSGIKCKSGDRATIIGRQKNEEVSAYELAQKLNTTHYEVVTCINPLICRKFI